MTEFARVWDQLAMPVQLRTLGRPLGFYKSIVGSLNEFVHLWAYRDLADYEQRVLRRDADPDWPEYLQASAQLIIGQRNTLLKSLPMHSLESFVEDSQAHS